MTDKKNTKKAPNLRFKGFTDDWEARKLGKIVEFYSGLTYSPDNIIPKGGTFVLRSSNVKNGELINADNVYVDSSFVNSSNVQIGDIVVVVRNGSRNLIGKHAQVKNYMENTVIGAFMTGIRAKEPNYINALLNTQQFKIEINKNLGATINQITTGAFKKMQFSITPNIEEQHEIGSFFDKLDNCITLHQRKLDQLNQLKEALLQQMFPGKGETVPKLRFAGFEGDWEENKLGQTDTYFTDGNYGEAYPSANDMSTKENGGVPFLRGSNFLNGYLDEANANYIKIEKHYELASGHIQEDDIILAVRGSLGTLGYATKQNVGWNINSQLAILRTKKSEIWGMFLTQYLLSHKGQKEMFSRITGTALKQLPIKQLKAIPVPIPNISEQKQVGSIFKQLDTMIALHQRKLDQIKNTKQVLLQNMFI